MKTVAYLRLSIEDGDGESSSISNQRKITTKFAQEHGMIIDEFYIDDGYSGYTMDRPSFNRLKRDLNNDVVSTIIFKDLSRLSRNNAKGQLFLESVLESGKRALTVHEGYDTLDPKTHKMVGIYGWINEDFIRDASMKTKESISILQKEGAFINCVPYGYVKDPFNKRLYYIDEVTAPYVKRMFDMYIGGMGVRAIAQKFNEENIPTARVIRKQRIESTGRTTKFKPTLWTGDVVQRMICNPFYIGTLTLNKTVSRTIRGKRSRTSPDQHYVFENAHEPLIDKDTFQLAQDIFLQRKAKPYRGVKIERPNIFSGVLVCADCGRNMTSASRSQNTRYVCISYNKYGTNVCTTHAVMEYEVKEALINFLKECREELIKIIDSFDDIFRREFNRQGDLESLQKDLERVKQEIKVLMEQKMRETMMNPQMKYMIDDMYNETINDKYKMIEYLEKQINDSINIESKELEIRQNFKGTIHLLDEIINTKEITKKQVLLLVDKIMVYEDGSLDIYLKGDLHELCSNKVSIQESMQLRLDKAMVKYILENKDHLTPTAGWKYVHKYDISIGFVKFNTYFNKFVQDNVFTKIEGLKRGYRFLSTEEALRKYTHCYNVVDNKGCLTNNNVTLDMLYAIAKLGGAYNRMKSNKKLLF